MQLYYSDIQAIEQQTSQLDHASCRHCGRTHQLVSHGFVYKKRLGGDPLAVGKRVFCSNRHRRTGCGRTMRLYLDAALRGLHYAGAQVVAFVFALMAGSTVRQAYAHATGQHEARHAWRWLDRLQGQLSSYRSLAHQPVLPTAAPAATIHPARRVLASTFPGLVRRFGSPLCANYQREIQRSFL